MKELTKTSAHRAKRRGEETKTELKIVILMNLSVLIKSKKIEPISLYITLTTTIHAYHSYQLIRNKL